MNRRRFLGATTGLLTTLAGCSGLGSSPSTPTLSPVSPPTAKPSSGIVLDVGQTYETPDGRTVTVRDVRVERLIRSLSVGHGTHITVGWLENHQFAVSEAEATGPNGDSILTDVRLALEVDGVQYPRDDQKLYWALPPGSTERPGQPAFPVPTTHAATGAIVWHTNGDSPVRWKLPPATIAKFGRAPSFSVSSFDTPDTVSRGSTFDASVTVGNSGDRAGRFIAEFGAGGVDYGEVVIDVPAGAERTHTGMLDPYYSENASEIRVVLDWGRERLARTLRVTD